MRALSWKQPFATAMLYGKIETRTWDTKYRGKVLICTSKSSYDPWDLAEICGERLHSNMIQKVKHDFALDLYGYAIGVGELVDSRPMELLDQEKAFVLYDPNLYCHIYENVQTIKPIQWKGTQGWKTLDDEFVKSLIYE